MTPREAINIIEDVTWQDNGRHYGKIDAAREISISAIEKQIPKKPIYKTEELFRLCPNCDFPLPLHFKFCNDCGQAIDWSDTE